MSVGFVKHTLLLVMNEIEIAGQQFELGSRWRRFFALWIDLLPFAFLFWVPLLNLALFAYILVRDAIPQLNGQSVGKRVLGLRVVHAETAQHTTGKYAPVFLRELPGLIPILNLVDALYIFTDSRKRLGDRWAKTVVIRDNSKWNW